MNTTHRTQGSRKTATVLAVQIGTQMRVLAAGRSITEAMTKAGAVHQAKREPAVLFVPRRDAIHVF
jgi:hypothetical protein